MKIWKNGYDGANSVKRSSWGCRKRKKKMAEIYLAGGCFGLKEYSPDPRCEKDDDWVCQWPGKRPVSTLIKETDHAETVQSYLWSDKILTPGLLYYFRGDRSCPLTNEMIRGRQYRTGDTYLNEAGCVGWPACLRSREKSNTGHRSRWARASLYVTEDYHQDISRRIWGGIAISSDGCLSSD